MAYAKQHKIEVQRVKHEVVTYERRSAFLGLISWFIRIKADTLADELHIDGPSEITTIYYNGKILRLKQNKQHESKN